jgi:hypothetical protein
LAVGIASVSAGTLAFFMRHENHLKDSGFGVQCSELRWKIKF